MCGTVDQQGRKAKRFMENQEKTPRKKRAKKAGATDFDTYVANVSNGLNPPSTAKRRKKKPDVDAYDAFLQETGDKVNAEPLSGNEDVTQLAMDIEAEKPPKQKKEPPKKQSSAVLSGNEDVLQLQWEMQQEARARQAKAKPKKTKKTDDYDAYLLKAEFAEEIAAEKPRKKKKGSRRKNRRKKQAALIYLLTVVAVLGVLVFLGVRQVQEYQRFQTMREVVEDQRFYQGTTVDGYDLSGMTLEEAQLFFENSVESPYRNRTVTLTTGEMFTAEQLGYSSNYYSMLRTAWSSGRSGTLEERYEAIMNGEHAATAYTVTRRFYSEDAVKAAVDNVAAHNDQPAREPQVTGFDVETCTFTLDEGQVGYVLDKEKLASDIAYVVANGGGKVEPIINSVPVQTDAATVAAQYGRISYMATDASSSAKNRLTNLDLASKAINGTRLDPGEEFSFNGVVGKRTAEKGYKEAGVYAGGQDAKDIGGGICQVGSTLFNVAVMADMDITARQPHSRPVSYLPRGRDAAINWPNQDLKFVNTGDTPVYIVTRLTKDKQVECAIYGKLPEDGHTVVLDSKTTESTEFETEYVLDPLLTPGTTETDTKGYKGYKAIAWKVTLDKDGNEIAREELCRSTYRVQHAVIRYNP